MKRSTTRNLIRMATAATAGAAALTALVGCGTTTTARHAAAAPNPQYSYYRTMMKSYGPMMGGGGPMMGGRPGNWMMGNAGYRWMTGIRGIPGWMHGGRLPGYMMGTSTDPGKIMGRFWANAPGPRIGPAQAAKLGAEIPAGARLDRAAGTITFTTASVRFTVLASPAGGPDETFTIAGLVNPKVAVPAGAKVAIQVINADPDTAHGLVITTSAGTRSPMPMMTARPAFAGSALWFLGNPTGAGMHYGTLTFTAATPGTYRYLCAVPGHASKGMIGTFVVTAGQ